MSALDRHRPWLRSQSSARSQVVVISFETIQPGDGGGSGQMRFGGERQLQEPRGVGLLHLRKLSASDQLLRRELVDGLEHGKARLGAVFFSTHNDQTLVDQPR